MQVISLGGSLLIPDKRNKEYTEQFIRLLEQPAILVCGGGAIARDAMRQSFTQKENDSLGITATRLNALYVLTELLHAKDKVCSHVITQSILEPGYDFYCAGGFIPGRTTDDVAVQLAIAADAKQVLNLTVVDGVYDKDPTLPGAVKYETMAWDDYLRLFCEHQAGMHAPFDPVAAKRAQQHGITVHVLDGTDLEHVKAALRAEHVGTILS